MASKEIENYFIQGNQLRQAGNIQGAISAYQRSIESDPTNPRSVWSYYHLGVCFQQTNNIDAAEKCYMDALCVQPSFPPACRKLMLIYKQNSEKIDKLISFLADQADLSKNSRVYKRLAEVLMNSGKKEEAISACRAATYHINQQDRSEFVEKYWHLGEFVGPSFIILGAPRCGTTSLYNYLNQHPQVLPSAAKELHFFTKEFKWGIDWYLANFPPIVTNPHFITGEASPTYLYSKVQEKVKNNFPKVKLIAMLRNPISRASSYYNLQIRHRLEKQTLEEKVCSEINILQNMKEEELCYVDDYSILGQGLYFYQLKKWLEFFPLEQIMVIKSEEFYRNTNKVISQVFEFLNLHPYQLSQDGKYRHYNSSSYTSMPESVLPKLTDFFKPHNNKLEDLLGIKLDWN